MSELPRNALGQHAEALIADVLDKREEAIITSVQGALAAGKLTADLALQKWIELVEARKLRSALIRRSQLENVRIGAVQNG